MACPGSSPAVSSTVNDAGASRADFLLESTCPASAPPPPSAEPPTRSGSSAAACPQEAGPSLLEALVRGEGFWSTD
ncbi:Unconventional myosin-X [Schistosoma japonicum]|uniref:Unconventional myosin-X n=1 Tax=Schistosoma japonicum TaxID=6182 RepID=A0A4Z2CL01_SCHJA|nr:Unconventional myosin-X [Schistosoma japonicum]